MKRNTHLYQRHTVSSLNDLHIVSSTVDVNLWQSFDYIHVQWITMFLFFKTAKWLTYSKQNKHLTSINTCVYKDDLISDM